MFLLCIYLTCLNIILASVLLPSKATIPQFYGNYQIDVTKLAAKEMIVPSIINCMHRCKVHKKCNVINFDVRNKVGKNCVLVQVDDDVNVRKILKMSENWELYYLGVEI